MKTLQLLLPAAGAAIILAGVFPAARSATAGPAIHWSDLRSAIENHPALKLAGAEADAATAEITARGQISNPEISASAGQARSLDGTGTGFIWGIDLSIPLEGLGVAIHSSKAATIEAEAARAEVIAARVEVEARLRTIFMTAVVDREIVTAAGQAEENASEMLKVAQARFDSGDGRMLDVVRLRAELERAEARLSQARARLGVSIDNLDRTLGGALPDGFTVEADWADLPAVGQLDEYLAQASAHPEIVAAEARTRAADEELKAEKARNIPDFKVGAFYERELDAHNYGATIGMTLPLWNHNRGGIAAGKARRMAAESSRELADLEIGTAIAEARASAVSARETAERYRDGIVPAAAEAARIALESYKLGETGLADVLDANDNWAAMRIEMLEAFLEGWIAAIRLTAFAGGEQ